MFQGNKFTLNKCKLKRVIQSCISSGHIALLLVMPKAGDWNIRAESNAIVKMAIAIAMFWNQKVNYIVSLLFFC